MLVQIPSGSVERSAHESPAGSPLASTVIAYGPSRFGNSSSRRLAPSSAACPRSQELPPTTSTRSAPSASAIEVAYRAIVAPLAAISTGEPGYSESWGATVRHASGMLSDRLATEAGSLPSGTPNHIA